MSDADLRGTCPICDSGRSISNTVDVTFQQITDRGLVTCHVALPRSICCCCGFEMFDAAADEVMDQAVNREYAKLPPAAWENFRPKAAAR